MQVHPPCAEIDEVARLDQLALRKSDSARSCPAGREIFAQDGDKIVLARPIDDPMLVVEAFNRAQ